MPDSKNPSQPPRATQRPESYFSRQKGVLQSLRATELAQTKCMLGLAEKRRICCFVSSRRRPRGPRVARLLSRETRHCHAPFPYRDARRALFGSFRLPSWPPTPCARPPPSAGAAAVVMPKNKGEAAAEPRIPSPLLPPRHPLALSASPFFPVTFKAASESLPPVLGLAVGWGAGGFRILSFSPGRRLSFGLLSPAAPLGGLEGGSLVLFPSSPAPPAPPRVVRLLMFVYSSPVASEGLFPCSTFTAGALGASVLTDLRGNW